ncbi:MAG: beta-glucosidase, partial [Clostridiales bacterium]|nr:beta-glucosidase [Clostridiales bacterium]
MKRQTELEFIKNKNGPTIGFCKGSGVRTIVEDDLIFKDHNGDGKLEPFEDWRLSAEERARDLAERLTIRQIAGLMGHSTHQFVPPAPGMGASYAGKPFEETEAEPWELTDQQTDWLKNHFNRSLLLVKIDSVENSVKWTNSVQELCEKEPFAIPCIISSDPRHASDNSQEFNKGSGNLVSLWPEGLGLAAGFDPERI